MCVCVESPAVFALLCPSETHPQSAACHFSVRPGCAAACCNQPLGVCAFLSLGAHTFPSPAACTPRAAQTHIPLPRPPCAVADGRGWTALHYVALRGDLALFNMLFSPTAPHLTPAAGWLVGGWVGGWVAGGCNAGGTCIRGWSGPAARAVHLHHLTHIGSPRQLSCGLYPLQKHCCLDSAGAATCMLPPTQILFFYYVKFRVKRLHTCLHHA